MYTQIHFNLGHKALWHPFPSTQRASCLERLWKVATMAVTQGTRAVQYGTGCVHKAFNDAKCGWGKLKSLGRWSQVSKPRCWILSGTKGNASGKVNICCSLRRHHWQIQTDEACLYTCHSTKMKPLHLVLIATFVVIFAVATPHWVHVHVVTQSIHPGLIALKYNNP